MENILILIINRTMRLIADHQIKMTAAKQLPILVTDWINTVDHRLIGRKDAVCLIVFFFFYQIGTGQVRKQIDKISFCLCHKRISICQKQNIFHPSCIQQNLTQCDNCSCFSGSSCHNQQRFSSVSFVKTFTDFFDCFFLIISSRDLLIDRNML